MKHNVIKFAVLSAAVSVILTTAFILDIQNCFGAPPSPPPPPRHGPSAPPPSRQTPPPPSNNGVRTTRVINTKTGKVLRVEPHGGPSPVRHTDPRPPRPLPPGILPPGPPPRPRPGLLPPPPPIMYWPVVSTSYNTTEIYNTTNYNSSPYESTEYPTIQLLGLYEVYDSNEKSCGWLLMYYEPNNKTLGGYFNPAGAKIVKKEWIKNVQGTVMTIDNVDTSWFRIDDEFGTTCFIPFKEMLYESIMSGTLRQASHRSDTPETTIFFLKRIK